MSDSFEPRNPTTDSNERKKGMKKGGKQAVCDGKLIKAKDECIKSCNQDFEGDEFSCKKCTDSYEKSV